jgi:hypothetical protein
MRSRRHRQELTGRIRRDRRRLGRFVAFAEIEADLSPISLFDQLSPSGAEAVPALQNGRHDGQRARNYR